MVIYDTKLKKRVPFEPIEKGKVRMYVCGVTVYDDAHLGHARSAIVYDLLKRTFTALGYEVMYVKNFTDIDDKIIQKIKKSNQDLETLTTHYINRYTQEMKSLNVLPANIEPKATQSLENITQIIQTLLDKKYAYKLDDGIYFNTSKDEEYLSLSHRHIQNAKARVSTNEQKKDTKDFALWKFANKDEVGFESQFGYGRPGWHIECSAMIKKHLAYEKEYQIDIHGGGVDLIFPHHENEAAQTRCALGQEIAKYWMHNGFVKINGEKMSKSLGNSFYLKDALNVYGGEVLRYYLSSTHYRADFNFNEKDLLASKKRLDKLYRLKKRVFGIKSGNIINEKFQNSILDALKDDLNISKALSIVDEIITFYNEKIDTEPKNKQNKLELVSIINFINEVLGFGAKNPYKYFQQGMSEKEKEKVEELIIQRLKAKKEKDFEKADEIRDELARKNIVLMDTAQGTQWEKDESL